MKYKDKTTKLESEVKVLRQDLWNARCAIESLQNPGIR